MWPRRDNDIHMSEFFSVYKYMGIFVCMYALVFAEAQVCEQNIQIRHTYHNQLSRT